MQRFVHFISHISLSNRDATSPYELSFWDAVGHHHLQSHHGHAPFWDVPGLLLSLSCLNLFSLFQNLCLVHTISFSLFKFPCSTQSHCFSQVSHHYPNWVICPCALNITSLKKCQLSSRSSLSSLPWNPSSSFFLYLFILRYAVPGDILSEKFCSCPGGVLFHCCSHKLKRKSRHMIKKCKSFACLH